MFVGAGQRELKLRAAHLVLDREFLHGLHVERDAGNGEGGGAETLDDLERGIGSVLMALQVDEHPAAVERRVGAVDSDERREAEHRGIGQHDAGECLLALGHRGEGNRLRGFGDGEDRGVVLHGEKPFWHDHVEDGGEDQRAEGDQQGGALAKQHPVEPDGVTRDHGVEEGGFHGAVGGWLGQHARAHHRREREGDDEGDQNRDGESDREFVKQPADDVAHEEQRNQHGDERDGERDEGEADLRGTLERGFHRGGALFTVAGDVFEHHDGIVHDETGGDGERHQREDVDRIPGEIHHAERADERQRHGDARDDRGGEIPEEHERHEDDEADGEDQLEFHGAYGGADALGAIGEDFDIDRRGQAGGKLREQLAHAIDHLDDVGPGLPLDVDQDGGEFAGPRGKTTIFGGVLDAGDVAEAERGVIPPGDDQIAVFLDGTELVVCVHQDRAERAVETALGTVDAGGADGGAHLGEAEAAGGELARIDLHADGRTLAAGEADHADAGNLREFLGDAGVHEIVDSRQRHARRSDGEGEDGRVGGVDLAVDRRGREVVGQEIAGGVDGGLNLLLGDAHRNL